MQLILLIGVQGAGKSTFCKQYFSDTHIRLNRDMLKTKHRERLLFEACLASKTSTVIDKTNPTKLERENYIKPALQHHFEVIAYYFDVPFEEARERNNLRENKAKIPEVGLKSTLKKMELPTFEEGFSQIYHVNVKKSEFIISEYKRSTE